MSRTEIESVGYRFGDSEETLKRYDPEKLKDGFNTVSDGETIYYVSRPAAGLWSTRAGLGR